MTLRVLIVLGTVCFAGAQVGSALAWLAAGQLAFDRGVRPLASLAPITDPPAAATLAGHLFPPIDETPPPPPRPPGEEALCEGRWRMVGSWIDRRVAERSFASLHTPDGALLVAAGQTIAGLTVVDLRGDAVIFAGEGGGRCRVGMHDDGIAAIPEERPPPPQGIGRGSSSHVEVDLDDIATLPRRLRALPHMVDGELMGVRLYGIRAGDPVHAAGARNGDLVRAVDGQPLSDPNVALDAYGRLRSGDPVRVTIERRGETIEVTLRASN